VGVYVGVVYIGGVYIGSPAHRREVGMASHKSGVACA